jgi:hypothetical protein
MPVSIIYKGRFGNAIFQYTAARIFAEKHREYLLTPFPYPGVLRPAHFDSGESPLKARLSARFLTKVWIEDNEDISPFDRYEGRRNYIFHGYFQDSRLYNQNVDQVKSIFALPVVAEKNYTDIVMHCRLGDFYHDDYLAEGHNDCSEIIHPRWYVDLLQAEKFQKLHIVLYDHKTPTKYVNRYLSYFEPFKPIVYRKRRAGLDFHFIRSFDRIICSNSTFSWWAAFLSQARVIYIPENIGYRGIGANYHKPGGHIQELWNIRNISKPVMCQFCDMKAI